MKISFGGGASEVGASFIVLQIDGKNIALDCGIRMTKGSSLPDFSILQSLGGVDCVLLSHAHTDHSGALPVLIREYPRALIYTTHPTKDLVRVLLYDSLKIMDRRESEIPIFADIHVEKMLDNMVCFSPNHSFKPFAEQDITVTFYAAGHILGAVGILVAGREGSLFYSGDFSVDAQRTVEGSAFPKLRPDVAIIESTYGDRLHASREVEEDRLIETIGRVALRKGKMLIPAFALGRAQEILLLIHRAISKKQLPGTLRVYVDGMVNDMCRVFSNSPNYLRKQYGKKILKGTDIFYNDNILSVKHNKELREKIVSDDDALVIISSSGMLTGGPSPWYAGRLSENDQNYIAITGYQDEESPGRMLLNLAQDAEKSLKIEDVNIPVHCEVGLYGLSAHADKMQIINLAHTLGAKQVLLNHGNEEVIESLASELQKEYPGRIYVPKNGETVECTVQVNRQLPSSEKLLPMTTPNADVRTFWSFVQKTYGNVKAFSIEDLYFVYGGTAQEGLADFRDLINSSVYFETEKKRPFIYHTVKETDLPQQSDAMEVNETLRLAGEYFPEETGLYKKGARFDEKVILLYFDFPIVQVLAAQEQINRYESITGWTVETNTECRVAAAENLVKSLLSQVNGVVMTKSPSYHRTENYFLITVSGTPADSQKICREFLEKTGMELRIADTTRPAPIRPLVKESRMEQNQVFALIDAAFSDAQQKPYKKSLKTRESQQGIELSFITKAAGERHRDMLDALEAETEWQLWINPSSNQHELIIIAQDCLAAENITAKKISYLPDKNVLQATLVAPVAPGILQAITDTFGSKTACEIRFLVK